MPEIKMSDVVSIIISQAPRGMGSRFSMIVDHLFLAYYSQPNVKRPHKSTISRNRRGITKFDGDLIRYYRNRAEELRHSIFDMLELYPGVAATYWINNQIGRLINSSGLPEDAKMMLQRDFCPDSTDIDHISTYVSNVMHYAMCCT